MLKRNNGYTYQDLKETAQNRNTWTSRCLEPALRHRT